LCWQTVEQQINPALAIASAVMGKFKTELVKQDYPAMKVLKVLKNNL
jgi:hypothetical protein